MKTGNHPNITEKLLIVTQLKHQNKQTKTSQSIAAQMRYSKDRPICYGTSPLKNGFCVNVQYALLKTLCKKVASSTEWL